MLKKKKKWNKPKRKMIAGAFLFRRRCGFSKDRRRAKNLPQIMFGIPSDKKSTGNLKS
jgi:hypothetical protein